MARTCDAGGVSISLPRSGFFRGRGRDASSRTCPLASGNIAADKNGDVLLSQSTNIEVDLAMVELRAE
jgi:hypothetical protein